MRRVRRYLITPANLIEFLSPGAKTYEVIEGVPNTALLIDLKFDPYRYLVHALFQDDSFMEQGTCEPRTYKTEITTTDPDMVLDFITGGD